MTNGFITRLYAPGKVASRNRRKEKKNARLIYRALMRKQRQLERVSLDSSLLSPRLIYRNSLRNISRIIFKYVILYF